ncbi:MAG: hypothetical protein AAFN48_01960 [Pseudomonadota bacterium]
MPTTILRTQNGYLDQEDEAKFDALSARLIADAAPLMIHIHGGLVDEDTGVSGAERLAGPEGYVPPDEYEQLFIVWRSGLLETLRTNWRELHRRDRLYRSLIGKLLEFTARKLGLPIPSAMGPESIGGAPIAYNARMDIERRLASSDPARFADIEALLDRESPDIAGISEDDFAAELEAELANDTALIAVAQDIEAVFAPAAESLSFVGNSSEGREVLDRLNPEVVGQLRTQFSVQSGAEGFGFSVLRKLIVYGAKIGWRVWRRFRSGRDHGIHATVIEEILRELYGDHIGSAIWTLMKDDTADHFKGRLGSRLLDLIQNSGERRIVLIGHSAGAVMVCNFLRAWQQHGSDTGRKADVVFLAPAVRDRYFAETLALAPDRIDRFRMFCLNDQREREDALFGSRWSFLYPSSLLYIVSGLFEDDDQEPNVDAPLLGMERFRRWQGGSLGGEEDAAAEAVKAFLASKPSSQVYAPSQAGSGLNSDARTHGGVDNDPDTLESVRDAFLT